MLAHCGLEWDRAGLSFHATNRLVLTESAVQVRRPIYRTSVERWRPPPDLLRPLLEGLGVAEAVGAAASDDAVVPRPEFPRRTGNLQPAQ